MYYTYALESIRRPGTRHIGQTSDLRRRLKKPNAGILGQRHLRALGARVRRSTLDVEGLSRVTLGCSVAQPENTSQARGMTRGTVSR